LKALITLSVLAARFRVFMRAASVPFNQRIKVHSLNHEYHRQTLSENSLWISMQIAHAEVYHVPQIQTALSYLRIPYLPVSNIARAGRHIKTRVIRNSVTAERLAFPATAKRALREEDAAASLEQLSRIDR
jgi:hypothetical protein